MSKNKKKSLEVCDECGMVHVAYELVGPDIYEQVDISEGIKLPTIY